MFALREFLFFLFFFLNPAASAVRPASGFWSKLVLESIKKKKEGNSTISQFQFILWIMMMYVEKL